MGKSTKGYRIRYAMAHGGGCSVMLPYDPRKGKCEGCGRTVESGEIKVTALHHWKYAYRAETVKKDPLKALENTSEYCFYCHKIADGIRAMLEVNPERAISVLDSIPLESKQKFFFIIRRMLELHDEKLKGMMNNPAVKRVFEVLIQ